MRTAAIHGNKSQGARTRALKDFKGGKVTILVATDIAARGLDIDQLPHRRSITICRRSPKITCTVSAAPAARARKVWPCRWWRMTKRICCATSAACSSRKFRSRRSPDSNRVRRSISIPTARRAAARRIKSSAQSESFAPTACRKQFERQTARGCQQAASSMAWQPRRTQRRK